MKSKRSLYSFATIAVTLIATLLDFLIVYNEASGPIKPPAFLLFVVWPATPCVVNSLLAIRHSRSRIRSGILFWFVGVSSVWVVGAYIHAFFIVVNEFSGLVVVFYPIVQLVLVLGVVTLLELTAWLTRDAHQ